MARRHVVATEMMQYERNAPKGGYLGWGRYATRKLHTRATSPRLLKYRGCVAGEISGGKYGSLKAVQEKFKSAAAKCAREV